MSKAREFTEAEYDMMSNLLADHLASESFEDDGHGTQRAQFELIQIKLWNKSNDLATERQS